MGIDSGLHDVVTKGSQNIEDNISAIIYLAGTTEDVIQEEVDITSELFSNYYKFLFKKDLSVMLNMLRGIDNSSHISLLNYKVNIADPWLFQVIVLNSIKYLDILPLNNRQTSCDQTGPLAFSVEYLLTLLNPLKQKSIYLLRMLQMILSRSDVLTQDLSLKVLKSMSKISLSPLIYFKHLAQGVSKIALQYLSYDQFKEIFNPFLLPEKGIEICDVLSMYSDDKIKLNTEMIMKKVLTMFSTNIENKDGGFLYERMLFFTFDEWKTEIWPHFCEKLKHIEYEGEFYQSLVKYWIPKNIAAYQTDFYMFLKDEPIDIILKATILQDTIKRGYPVDDIDRYFYNIETANLGLRMVATYHKKSLCPQKSDFDMVMNFLYSNINCYLENEEVKSMGLFFSHVCLYMHSDLKKTNENFNLYKYFVDTVYDYCFGTLNTEFFEVGAQILQILWNTLTGSSKNLSLSYKIEKKDFYENGDNLLYIRLKTAKFWKFENQEIIGRLKECFIKNECYSFILTNLIHKYYSSHNFVDVKIFKFILDKIGDIPTIQNTEKVINCCNILFKVGENGEAIEFIKYIQQSLLQYFLLPHEDKILFRKVLYLEILTLARRHEFDVEKLEELIEKSLQNIDSLLENDVLRSFNYRSIKIFETFISRVMFCIAQDMNYLWPQLNKDLAISTLIKIIQKSNLRKSVSLSVDILRQFGLKMEEDEESKILKINLVEETLQAMYEVPQKHLLKIRRSPESRLVIHAMCLSQKNTKLYLDWVLNSLLKLITDPNASDYSISPALHTIEILISDNRLQYQTLHFIPEILVQCVELFQKASWIVRNADLQLVKALIERIYGVSMNSMNRPKNIEDLFTLYPKLSTYFFKILSSGTLEERAVIVFQFFSESQVKQGVFNNQISDILDYFRVLFIHIIKNYENHYGMLAVRSYVSICLAEYIPKVISDITDFVGNNFVKIKKNILSNFVFLLKELVAKYEDSFENNINSQGLKDIHSCLNNFASSLQRYETNLFDFLLLKVRSKETILKCLNDDTYLSDRLWLHNNIPFLVIGSKPSEICHILDEILFKNIPSFIEVKILSILISKYEKDHFSIEDQSKILRVLFEKALGLDDINNYTLTCYFKVILVFMRNMVHNSVDLDIIPAKSINLYKTMITVLYVSVNNGLPKKVIEDLYPNFEKKYIDSISINEEVDNDLASTLIYYHQQVPQKHCLVLAKMMLYFSLFRSTHYEIYYFISSITDKSYLGSLDALKNFMSMKNLKKFIRDEESLKIFFNSVCNYLDETPEVSKDFDDFYATEGDELIPKSFLCKIMRSMCTMTVERNKE